MNENRNKEIIRLYKKGYPMTVLATKYGVTRTAIWFVIKQYREKRGISRSSHLRSWGVDNFA